MRELVKVKSLVFEEQYEGIVGDQKIVCVLDDNCVRWTTCRKIKGVWKLVGKHEYQNSNKARCFNEATKALNKIA